MSECPVCYTDIDQEEELHTFECGRHSVCRQCKAGMDRAGDERCPVCRQPEPEPEAQVRPTILLNLTLLTPQPPPLGWRRLLLGAIAGFILGACTVFLLVSK